MLELNNAIKKAQSRGNIPERLLDEAKRIAELELKEDGDCPVPKCLAALIESSCNKITTIRTLVEILDARDQHFKHPNRPRIFKPD